MTRGARGCAPGARGLTLVEVLIVVALIALLAGAVAIGSGALFGSRLRASAALVLNAVQLGLNHANTSGLPTRLVFELDEGRLRLEESTARMLRRRDEDAEHDPSAGAAPATELEREATEEARRIVDGPREPPPSFTPVAKFGTAADAKPGRALGAGVRIVSVQTEHDTEARSQGRAYLYFWPGGGTEKAIVYLERSGSEEGLSVAVSALTGRVELVRGRVEYETPAGVDMGERDEE